MSKTIEISVMRLSEYPNNVYWNLARLVSITAKQKKFLIEYDLRQIEQIVIKFVSIYRQ